MLKLFYPDFKKTFFTFDLVYISNDNVFKLYTL